MADPSDPIVDYINLRQLSYWLTTVEEGSVTGAARRLAISQPALSQHIRALERRLGGPLLERLPRGVQPTPLGRALLRDARGALESAKRLDRRARETLGLESGVVEVVTLPSLVDATLLRPLEQWHHRHHGVAIRLHEFPIVDRLVNAVAAGLGDVAISNRPANWPGPIVHLGWEQFVALLPPGDAAASSTEPITLSELADREWVLYERANGLSNFVSVACARAGFQPREAVSTSQVQAVPGLVAAGLGCALVPSDNVPRATRGVARPLQPPVIWELTAFARTVMSGAAAAFVDLVRARPSIEAPVDAIVLPGT